MRIGIIGAGFGGLAAAIAFRQRGHDVCVYEKTAGPSAAGGAIALAPNALACLSVLGVRDEVATQPWSGMAATVRASDGRVLVRRTLAQLTGGREFAVVPRAQLIGWLADRVPDRCLRFSTDVTSVDEAGVVTADGGRERFDLVVGADGQRGVARRLVWPDAPPPRNTGISGWAWTVDVELTSGFGPIWGRTADFGILPLADGRTYVYGGALPGHADLSAYRDWPAPLPMLIDAARPEQMITPQIFEARPPRRLVRGNVALIGDAAHAMRPTFGQGAALAMEDAITLARGGTSALARRRPRMSAMYTLSKVGSLFATPGVAAAERARNTMLQLIPDPLFGVMAGSVSRRRTLP